MDSWANALASATEIDSESEEEEEIGNYGIGPVLRDQEDTPEPVREEESEEAEEEQIEYDQWMDQPEEEALVDYQAGEGTPGSITADDTGMETEEGESELEDDHQSTMEDDTGDSESEEDGSSYQDSQAEDSSGSE